jgi:hypothetical protein
MKQVSLYSILNDYQDDKVTSIPNTDGLLSLIRGRCRTEMVSRLARRLAMPGVIERVGLFNRVRFDVDTNTWSYCAGQSYTDEIRWVREFLLK